MGVWSPGLEDPLEKEMATHCSILAWRNMDRGAWLAMGLQSVRQDRACIHTCTVGTEDTSVVAELGAEGRAQQSSWAAGAASPRWWPRACVPPIACRGLRQVNPTVWKWYLRKPDFRDTRMALLYVKCITNKDLLNSTGNSAPCDVAAWTWWEFGGEWIRVYIRLSLFTVLLKLSQHSQLAILQ